MISSHEIFRCKDIAGKNDVEMEVNWNPEQRETNECKMIRISMGGKTAMIDRKVLNEVLLVCGTQEDIKNLTPVTVVENKWYETVVGVKVAKDMKKGEEARFRIKIPLPSQEKEIIGQLNLNKIAKGSKIISPGN